MKAQANVNLHNRFDIEVRGAITGELKQTAQAENIVLDAMWTRLCGGSSYFVNIHFGTGTGTLAPTRTSLFTHLGTKTAVDDTLVKAIPNSSWKRKIVLNPEEYVGSVLSEVGIAYGSTSSYLVTHAMLEDSEGNPITITKTDTDIITIYATVFITFSTQSAEIGFIKLPLNNTLVNYLVGGASAPTGYFEIGEGKSPVTTPLSNGLQAYIGTPSSQVTWTADTANKRRTTNLSRFSTTQGIGAVREVSFNNVFRMSLPAAGIFTGQVYTGVAVGTGDGLNREFILPSKDIKDSTLVIKENGTPISNYQKQNYLKVTTPRFLFPWISANTNFRVARAKNANVMSVLSPSAPFQSIYYDYDGTLVSGFNVPSASSGYATAISGNGNVVAFSTSAPAVTTFERVGQNWISRGNPPSAPGYASGLALSNDGNVLYIGGSSNGYLAIYDWSGTEWIKRSALPTQPVSDTKWISLSPNETVLALAANNLVWVYDLVGSDWIFRGNITATNIIDCSVDDVGNVMFSKGSTPYFEGHDWSGTAWVKRADPSAAPTAPHGTMSRVSVTLGVAAMIYLVATDNFVVYYWDGLEWIKYVLTYGTDSNLRGFDIDPIAKRCFILPHTGNAYAADLETRNIKIIFDTAPAAGVAITADYTVDGVHKTDQYVIDVGFSIQFGEPV